MLHVQFQFPNELDYLKIQSLCTSGSKSTCECRNASGTLNINPTIMFLPFGHKISL